MKITFIPREKQHSEYDWADITYEGQPVGKARCKIENRSITIYSINIYTDWRNHGFGRKFVEYCQKNFRVVIADRVRPTAVGFWETMSFVNNNDGNWIYRN